MDHGEDDHDISTHEVVNREGERRYERSARLSIHRRMRSRVLGDGADRPVDFVEEPSSQSN